MWATLLPILLKYGVPLAIQILEKAGVISRVDGMLVSAGTHVLVAVEGVKTYSQNDQLNPADSDFPAPKGRDHL